MYANYHTHTYLCHHASGTPEEYVKEAIRNGVKILGFSDHNPCIFDIGHFSHYRMEADKTEEYVRNLVRLRELYKDKIRIYIGYEAEYYPRLWDATLQHMKKYGCDYLILGQHFTNNEYDGLYVAKVDCDEALLHTYVEQSIAAMKTGVFSAFAHPDVIRYDGDAAVYRREMTRLCEAAKEMHLPLELNLHGLRLSRHYPSDAFWQIAAAVGNTAIIGCDAHDAEFVGHAELYDAGLTYLRSFGIEPLRELELIKP